MTTGQRYHYNFLGFPGGEGEFVGIGTGNDDDDCPVRRTTSRAMRPSASASSW